MTVQEAVNILIEGKATARRRVAYVRELSRILRQFCAFSPILIADVTDHHVSEFARLHSASAWTQATVISRLSTLFRFSVRRRWILHAPTDFIERVSVDHERPVILTPQQVRDAAAVIPPRGLAWFSLCTFAGLRPQEAEGLSWEAIDFEARRIIIDGEKTKTRRHRTVTPPAAAWDWLCHARELDAALPLPHTTRRRFIRTVRDAIGLARWPQDVLRHTAASYWLAECRDPATLAFQLGNSPSVLMRHYWHQVTPEESAEFWSIRPPLHRFQLELSLS